MIKTDSGTISVYPAQSSDGSCNACECDTHGRYPMRKTFNVRMNSMSFRICDVHLGSLIGQARGMGWRPPITP